MRYKSMTRLAPVFDEYIPYGSAVAICPNWSSLASLWHKNPAEISALHVNKRPNI